MDSPIAEQIAQRVLDRYATCNTYADRGRHVCIHGPDGPPRSRHYNIIHFETRFQRPDRFYFEYLDEAVGPRESWSRFIVVQTDGECRSWWSTRPDEPDRELGTSLAAATGVSSGTSSAIPSLILPGVTSRFPILVPAECEPLDDVDIDGAAHWCIRGNPGRSPRKLLLIDPDTLLIRRVTDRTEITPRGMRSMLEAARQGLGPDAVAQLDRLKESCREMHITVSQTDYAAAFDIDLPADAFRFEPG